MNGCSGALAIFVKTPGVSPVKTRLAKSLGRERAEEFFRLSLAAVETTVAAAANASAIQPYWAVAEEDALEYPPWRRLPRVFQGAGSLGDRLARVFTDLGSKYDAVVAIGGDSPQISPELIDDAFDVLRQGGTNCAHVLGRCPDGGFYLIGTNRRLPASVWRNVPYGTGEAASQVATNLADYGRITELVRLVDVDRVEDLPALRSELDSLSSPNAEQLAVLEWTKGVDSVLR